MKANDSNTPLQLSRRDFVAVGTAAGALLAAATAVQAADTGVTAASPAPLDIAEWSFFWVGVERVDLARGAVVNGKQMYVEYQIPAQVRHPYPIVLVHGGGGQGLDWMSTPDGRPGWSTYLLQEGFKVYVVDRPGLAAAPSIPTSMALSPGATSRWNRSPSPSPPSARTRLMLRPTLNCTISGRARAPWARQNSHSSWHPREVRTCRIFKPRTPPGASAAPCCSTKSVPPLS